jgi:outer membrane murein-binding lipoprotein Lpp
MVREFGLRNGTRILFPGTTTEYMVEGRPEMYSGGLYLNASEYRANDYIFTELKLDKYSFCSMLYGYGPKSGDWPEVDGADYAAITRVVVCLMELCELRESDKVKNLRAELAELTAQRESYEEDVQAAKQTVQEAEEAASQARLALSYEECALETLQEDIDELEEAIEEALAGK